MLPHWIHKDFKWNGLGFKNAAEIVAFAQQNCPEALDFFASWLGEQGRITVNTSGSTGDPKEIQLTRAQMIASARATGDYFNLDGGSKALLCLPLQYIAGKMMLVRAMTLGWELWSSFPVTDIELAPERVFDFTAMVPLQLAKHPDILQKTGILLLGGGQVSKDLELLVQGSPCKVFQSYGMTETISHVALRPLNGAAGKEDGEAILYQALPGIVFSLDHRECLVIHAPRIAAETIVTNDLVALVSKTSFRWLARYDNVINTGGVKLIPERIEEKLSRFISGDFFAYGLDDEVLGQRLVLVVEGSPSEGYAGGRSDLMAALKQYQRENPNSLANYEIPKAVYFIPKMLRTATGKIRRAATVEEIRRKGSII